MNNSETETITHLPSRAIFGPISLLFGLFLLYFKESELFVALTAAAMLGLMLSWKWEKNGLFFALLTLVGVDIYQLFWSENSLTFWEFGLSASLAIAYVTTSLAKTEINDIVEEQAQEQIEVIQSELFSLKEVLQKYERVLKEKNSKIETLEQVKGSLEPSEQAPSDYQETLKRYENAIHEKNVIIDDLHERLDKIDLSGTVSVDILKKYEESLQEKTSFIENLQEKNSAISKLLEKNNVLNGEKEAELENQRLEISKAEDEKSAALAIIQEKLVEKESIAAKLQAQMSESELTILQLKEKMTVKDSIAAKLQAQMSESETAMLQFNEKIAEKESIAAMLQAQVSESETAMLQLKEKIEVAESNLAIGHAKAEHDLLTLQGNNTFLAQSQEKIREKVETLESELNQLQASLKYEKEQNSSLERQLIILREDLFSAKKQEEVVILKEKKIQQLEEGYKTLREQVKEHETFNFTKLLEKDRLIEKNTNRVKELEGETVKKTNLVNSYETKIKNLSDQIEELLEKLKQVESDKEELEKAIGSNESITKSLARVEGMHRQLREQFEEKSKVLNQTRKELFQINEEKNSLQMNLLEETKFGRAPNIESLDKYIIDLTKIIESQEEEIEILQELVAHNVK